MTYTEADLREAHRQIASTLHKLREAAGTMEKKENANRLKSQITLAKRRITALEIANALIAEKLEQIGENT